MVSGGLADMNSTTQGIHMVKVQFFINGEWCDSLSGETLDVFDPATEEKFGEVAALGERIWSLR
jgi:hypothetical protein